MLIFEEYRYYFSEWIFFVNIILITSD